MNTVKHTMSPHWLGAVSVCVMFVLSTAPIVQAQETIRIDLGRFLGRLMNSGAILEARKKWDQADPELKECLVNTHHVDVERLIQEGMFPTDRRISGYVKRCNEKRAKEQREAEVAKRTRQAQLQAREQVRDAARRKREASLKARRAAEEARRSDLTAKYGTEMAKTIIAGKVVMGMTREQVTATQGNPVSKDVIPPGDELWHYGSRQIAFTSGKVTYIGR